MVAPIIDKARKALATESVSNKDWHPLGEPEKTPCIPLHQEAVKSEGVDEVQHVV